MRLGDTAGSVATARGDDSLSTDEFERVRRVLRLGE
jgi:hypothetical protein